MMMSDDKKIMMAVMLMRTLLLPLIVRSLRLRTGRRKRCGSARPKIGWCLSLAIG